MVTLLQPSSGTLLLDGVPVADWDLAAVRSQLGVVMQEDTLVAGSFAENIAFFDADSELDWIRHCARTAGLDAEIMAKPEAYDTPVSDWGTALSGGQRQRLLLARALYRRPRILLLDEGTSHLDLQTERDVNRAISNLGITRIMIAHRPDTIAAADRVYRLAQGKIHTLVNGVAMVEN
jgi:ATP-binding cassette subfamily B protein RaxB